MTKPTQSFYRDIENDMTKSEIAKLWQLNKKLSEAQALASELGLVVACVLSLVVDETSTLLSIVEPTKPEETV